LTFATSTSTPTDLFPDNPLRFATQASWTKTVMANFDLFLQDHAAAEKKASGMALSMISHYPDKPLLIEKLADLAVEELQHFREVIKWLHQRGQQLAADTKDHYILQIREHVRKGREVYFLDRLITAGIIEARGCERFGLVGAALPEGELKSFYLAISRSEQRHFSLFINLAHQYFDKPTVDQRVNELLDIEAGIVKHLPIRAALH
jgi:tRNA-(ms[2]io[6]A)-hydroxylase